MVDLRASSRSMAANLVVSTSEIMAVPLSRLAGFGSELGPTFGRCSRGFVRKFRWDSNTDQLKLLEPKECCCSAILVEAPQAVHALRSLLHLHRGMGKTAGVRRWSLLHN